MTQLRGDVHSNSYLYTLDIARGIAALAVVLWHWQHFFFRGPLPGSFERSDQPFYAVFSLFYEKGWMAVDFFFVLSGFIFFRLYARPIREKSIGLQEFIILRLSRLYPLHIFTLLLVGGLQYVVISLQGHSFVYPYNDIYHFLLNIFFAPAWGFQNGFSFNAPIWSVSVEILLYAIFFFFVSLLRLRFWHVLLLAALGFCLQDSQELIGRGFFAFYMGGAACIIFQILVGRRLAGSWSLSLLGVCIGAWLITVSDFHWEPPADALDSHFGFLPELGEKWVALWVVGFLFPLSILCLALLESGGKGNPLPGRWLGEISYSSYLLHFPLQLIFLVFAHVFGLGVHVFYSPIVWLFYFLLLVIASVVIHRFFERPIQRTIRHVFYERRLRKASEESEAV